MGYAQNISKRLIKYQKRMASQGDNLTGELVKTACYCLNEEPSHTYQNLFMGDHTLFLRSDADEQLVLHLAFNQTVSLKKLEVGVLGNDSCPDTVKLFVNKTNMGFSEATDIPSTQNFNIKVPATESAIVPLNLLAAKWQRVDSITIFIENNHGAAQSILYSLKVYGTTVHTTNVSNIKNAHPDH